MKEFINNLFVQMGFQRLQTQEINLFSFAEDDSKKVYWAVVEWADLDRVAEQAEIFASCRELINQPEIDKNLSLLILTKQNDAATMNDVKSAIMKIEENPHFFKKYVLHYAEVEYEQLQIQQGEKQSLEFVIQQIVNADCFKSYKSDHKAMNWQSLVYRLAVKIPFIPITIKTNKGLASLFEDNQSKLDNKNLRPVNDHVLGEYGSLTLKQIEDISADDILNKLIPIIK